MAIVHPVLPAGLVVLGFLIGLCVGLTGMGGGVLMTPVLILWLKLPPSTAVGTDLAYAGLTKLVGAWQHWRQGTVDLRLAGNLALGSLPGSLLALAVVRWMRHHEPAAFESWLQRVVGGVLLLAVALMIWQIAGGRRPAGAQRLLRRSRVLLIGGVGGVLVGLTSVGSGSLMLALLTLSTSLPAERLVGTDVAHAALLTAVAALGYGALGQVNGMVAALLLLGSVPGVSLGSRLALRLPRRVLQAGLASLLMLSSFFLLR